MALFFATASVFISGVYINLGIIHQMEVKHEDSSQCRAYTSSPCISGKSEASILQFIELNDCMHNPIDRYNIMYIYDVCAYIHTYQHQESLN